jgi:hypothetical protein
MENTPYLYDTLLGVLGQHLIFSCCIALQGSISSPQ